MTSPVSTKGFRLSLQQKRLWLLQQEGRRGSYSVQCAIQVEGSVNYELLQQAWHQVQQQHEILRSRFVGVPGIELPMQVSGQSTQIGYRIENLEECNEAEVLRWRQETLRREREQLVELASDVVLRVVLGRVRSQRHVMIVSLPALCADATTLRLLLKEVGQCYEELTHPNTHPRTEEEEEPLQYVDVSAWQNEILEEEDAEEQRVYWSQQKTGE